MPQAAEQAQARMRARDVVMEAVSVEASYTEAAIATATKV